MHARKSSHWKFTVLALVRTVRRVFWGCSGTASSGTVGLLWGPCQVSLTLVRERHFPQSLWIRKTMISSLHETRPLRGMGLWCISFWISTRGFLTFQLNPKGRRWIHSAMTMSCNYDHSSTYRNYSDGFEKRRGSNGRTVLGRHLLTTPVLRSLRGLPSFKHS